MKNRAILSVFVTLIIVSCSPCRNIAKYEYCFAPDTIKINNESIHYEKVYITEDSLVYDTVPCDPITETAISVETVYKTIYKTKTDTIYKNLKVVKVNPADEKLKKQNDRYSKKIHTKNIAILIISIILLVAIVIIVFLVRFKM